MAKVKLPKDGVLFKPDYSKKIEYNKTYSRIRFTIWNLTNRLGITKHYKKESENHLMLVDNFLHYIEKEQYIV